MPRHANVSCPSSAPTLLTTNDVTSCRITNVSGLPVVIQATATAVAPISSAGGVPLRGYQTWAADLSIADMFPGVTTPVRLWAFADTDALLSVSHA